MLFSALVLTANALAQGAEDLADIFGLEVEEAEKLFEESVGVRRTMTGLVLADLLGTTSPERALEQLGKLPSETLREPVVVAYASAIQCSAFVRQAQLEQAQALCATAHEYVAKTTDPFLKARLLAAVQFLAIRQGQLSKALEYAFEAERWAAATGHPYVEATALNSIALALAFSGLHERAIQKFEQAQSRLHGIEERAINKMIAFNLGVSYRESGSFEAALEAFRGGYEWAESTGQLHRAFIGRIETANALGQLERWQESIDLLRPALQDTGAKRDPDSHMHALLVYGRAQVALGNTDGALKTYSEGLDLARSYQNTRRQWQLELAKIECLCAADRPAEATAEAQDLVARLRQAQPNDELDTALDLLSRLQAKTGDSTNAYQNLIESREMREASQGRSFARKLALMEVADRLEFAERERELAEERLATLHEAARKDRLIALALGIGLLLAMATAFLAWRSRKHALTAADHLRKSAELERVVDQRNQVIEDHLTHRMRGDEVRQDLEDQLAETEKSRALGQLTGGVAHDFNNLMTVVSGAAEMLRDEPDMDSKEHDELIEAIRNAADTGQKINAGLLAYARRQKLTPEPVDLEQHLSDSRRLFQGTLGEEMVLDINARPLTIEADKGQLTTAIINLLSNARDASKSRGSVSIEVEPLPEESAVKLSVKDSGCGMTAEEVAKSTDPFYSSKETTLASGLGLSRVYGFVRQSGGRLEIDSEPGEGTVVSLIFPAASDRPTRSDPPSAASSVRLRVLLVDDNDDVRKMVARMLKNLGHEVDTAMGGEAALEKLDAAVPDLLISDVLMPGDISGRELAKTARDRHPGLPILMISGFAEAPDLDFPLLSKPFNAADLETAISRLIAEHATQDPSRK